VTIKVVDASRLAAIVFDEPDGDAVTEVIRDCELVAPSLLGYEMANICWIKVRRKPDEREALLSALRMPGLPRRHSMSIKMRLCGWQSRPD
jgi:predicted nucleic acid-binding protein